MLDRPFLGPAVNHGSPTLERKFEEMNTVHDVSVVRMEYPSNVTGGWGELPVADGSVGGFSWQVRFLRNPGTYGGSTFPPGSGDLHSIVATDTALTGTAVKVQMQLKADGSRHLDGGALRLTYAQADRGAATTEKLAFNLDAASVAAALTALDNVGAASVGASLVSSRKVEGVQVRFPRDAPFGLLSGPADLTRFVAPGEG